MFEWLTTELRSIRTPKFHLIEIVSEPEFQKAVSSSPLRLSNDYKVFAVMFGNSRFFRQSLLGYKLGVLAGPRKHPKQVSAYQVGFSDGNPVFLREDVEGVFANNFKKPIAETFEAWLEDSYHKIKADYSSEAWGKIKSGPQPFDDVEATVIEARKYFKWREVGISDDGDRLLEFENNSDNLIPCFSIGVRSTDGSLNGAIIIDVKELAPGSKEVYAVACYKQFYNPRNLNLFDLPKLGPEDREFLAELKRLR